jgi:rod shape-determining protein MreB
LDKGITITGGGSLLANLDTVIRKETGVPVNMAADPLSTVVIGSGIIFEQFDRLRDVLVRC